jgi:hypothetical protein
MGIEKLSRDRLGQGLLQSFEVFFYVFGGVDGSVTVGTQYRCSKGHTWIE